MEICGTSGGKVKTYIEEHSAGVRWQSQPGSSLAIADPDLVAVMIHSEICALIGRLFLVHCTFLLWENFYRHSRLCCFPGSAVGLAEVTPACDDGVLSVGYFSPVH